MLQLLACFYASDRSGCDLLLFGRLLFWIAKAAELQAWISGWARGGLIVSMNVVQPVAFHMVSIRIAVR